jgi:hypothetical protein
MSKNEVISTLLDIAITNYSQNFNQYEKYNILLILKEVHEQDEEDFVVSIKVKLLLRKYKK